MNQTFIDCGVTDLISGGCAEVTGIEGEPDGALRVYVGPRYKGIYAVVEPAATEAQEALRQAWDGGGHVLIPVPSSDRLMRDE